MGKPNHRTLEARGVLAASHIFSWISSFVSFLACVFHTIGEALCLEEIWSHGKPSSQSEPCLTQTSLFALLLSY